MSICSEYLELLIIMCKVGPAGSQPEGAVRKFGARSPAAETFSVENYLENSELMSVICPFCQKS
jgi:hypothetical protein